MPISGAIYPLNLSITPYALKLHRKWDLDASIFVEISKNRTDKEE